MRGEGRGGGGPALRLGFREIKGFTLADAEALMAARGTGYTIRAISCAAPGSTRRRSSVWPKPMPSPAWACRVARRCGRPRAWGAPLPPLLRLLDNSNEREAQMPIATLGEEVVNDYAALRFTLREHPIGILRDELATKNVTPASQLAQIKDGAPVTVAGLSITRQRPGEGNIVFVTLEDETGIANIVVRIPVYEMYRRAILSSALMAVQGRMQKVGDLAKGDTLVIHVVADRCWDWSSKLGISFPKTARAPHPCGRRATISTDFCRHPGSAAALSGVQGRKEGADARVSPGCRISGRLPLPCPG